MRRKWNTEDGKPPYHKHPFCVWVRSMTKRPDKFARFQIEFDIPRATAYKWAAGECLPSGKYLDVYEHFIVTDQGALS